MPSWTDRTRVRDRFHGAGLDSLSDAQVDRFIDEAEDYISGFLKLKNGRSA